MLYFSTQISVPGYSEFFVFENNTYVNTNSPIIPDLKFDNLNQRRLWLESTISTIFDISLEICCTNMSNSCFDIQLESPVPLILISSPYVRQKRIRPVNFQNEINVKISTNMYEDLTIITHVRSTPFNWFNRNVTTRERYWTLVFRNGQGGNNDGSRITLQIRWCKDAW